MSNPKPKIKNYCLTLEEIHRISGSIIDSYPEAANYRILVDTEARRFPAHMIDVRGFYYNKEDCEAIGQNFITIQLDLIGTEP